MNYHGTEWIEKRAREVCHEELRKIDSAKPSVQFKTLLDMEVQVKRVNKYGPQEISVGFITHPDDYTLEKERIFFESKASGKTYRLVLLEEVEDHSDIESQWVVGKPLSEEELKNSPMVGDMAGDQEHDETTQEDDKEKSKLLSTLHIEMIKYARFKNTPLATIIAGLHTRLGIASRRQMTVDQIKEEIDSMNQEIYGTG